MGKYKHEGKGRNISVSGGQERKDLFKDMSGGYNAMGDSNQPLYKYDGSVAKQRYSAPMELTAEGKKKILASDANPEFKKAIAKSSVSPATLIDPKKSKKDTYREGGKKPILTAAQKKKRKENLENADKSVPRRSPATMKGKAKGGDSGIYKKGCTSGSGSNAPYKKLGDPKSKLKNKINKLSGKHKKLFNAYDQGQEVDEGKLGRVEDKLERKEKKYTKKYGSSPYSMYKHKK